MKRVTLLAIFALLLLVVPSVLANHYDFSGGGGTGDCVTPDGETCIRVFVYMGSLNPNLPENHPCHDGHVREARIFPLLANELDDEVSVVYIIWLCDAQSDDGGPGYSGEDVHGGGDGRNDSAQLPGNNGVSDHAPGHTSATGAAGTSGTDNGHHGEGNHGQGQGNQGQGQGHQGQGHGG